MTENKLPKLFKQSDFIVHTQCAKEGKYDKVNSTFNIANVQHQYNEIKVLATVDYKHAVNTERPSGYRPEWLNLK